MEIIQHTSQADQWIATLFSAKAAQNGGVVRRHRASVVTEIGRAL